jgi:hypothetical protein
MHAQPTENVTSVCVHACVHACTKNDIQMVLLNTVTHQVSPNMKDPELRKSKRKHDQTVKHWQIVARQIKRPQISNIFHHDVQNYRHDGGCQQWHCTILCKIWKQNVQLAFTKVEQIHTI